MVVARSRCGSGIMMKTEVNTAGISMPPQKPCATRNATSAPIEALMAQPRLARVKAKVAAANIQRSEKARVRSPVRGIAITSAIR